MNKLREKNRSFAANHPQKIKLMHNSVKNDHMNEFELATAELDPRYLKTEIMKPHTKSLDTH